MVDHRELWMHKRSGEVSLVWFDEDGMILGAYGPVNQRDEGVMLYGPLPDVTIGLGEDFDKNSDDYRMVEKTDFDLARQRVEGNESFPEDLIDIILYTDWMEVNHLEWICTASADEIVDWARSIQRSGR